MKTINKERQTQLDRAIAYFMGWRINNTFPDKGRVWSKNNSVEFETTFKFSSDWNALMDVYEEVNKLEKYYCRFYPGYCAVYERNEDDKGMFKEELAWQAPHKEPEISTQEAVYRCLGEFIELYNKKKLELVSFN